MPLTHKNIAADIDKNRNIISSLHSNEVDLEELENRSKIFARILSEFGCAEGDPVCCIMNNSIDFLIALRGIMYAGCVCIPVNPQLPPDRIQSIILESSSQWLIADRCARPLLKNQDLGRDSLSVGWMDELERLPEGCLPEFVKANINHISLHLILHEPEEKEAVVTFYGINGERGLNKTCFLWKDVQGITKPMFKFLQLDSNSKVAGLMSCNSGAVLLETMSLFHRGARLSLFDSAQGFTTELFSEIYDQKISHLFIDSNALHENSGHKLPRNIVCPSVEKLVLWGEQPCESVLDRLKSVFPNAGIFGIAEESVTSGNPAGSLVTRVAAENTGVFALRSL